MKSILLFAGLLLSTVAVKAQNVALPAFLKWQTNNSPGCKNVGLTKDSMLLAVKNKCESEGIAANWRPSVNVTPDQLHFTIPAGASVKMTITYKFKSIGEDVFGFYGNLEPEGETSVSSSLVLKDGTTSIPPSDNYTQAVIWINFTSENEPVWKSPEAIKGSMNFDFRVTTSGGETHQGSVAVIKDVKLEIVNN